jgi:hypothetical protein
MLSHLLLVHSVIKALRLTCTCLLNGEIYQNRSTVILPILWNFTIFLKYPSLPRNIGALTFSPPTFSPSDNLTHMVGLVTDGLLNFSTHIFLVPVLISLLIFCPPLGEGGLIVTSDSWSNLLWQLVHLLCEVKLGPVVTRSLAADDSRYLVFFLWQRHVTVLCKISQYFFMSIYNKL